LGEQYKSLYLRINLQSCDILPVKFPNKIFVCISFLSHLIWLDFFNVTMPKAD
jgi:hypothetical protein